MASKYSNWKLVALSFLLVLFVNATAFGQLPIENHVNLSLKDGLSDRAVTGILQDSKGFLWISTFNGLNRYDGYNFLVFDNNSSTKFQTEQSRIHHMEELAGNKLGLYNRDNQSFFEVFDLESFQTQKVLLSTENGIDGNCLNVFFEKHGAAYALSSTDSSYHFFKSDSSYRFKKMASMSVESTLDNSEVMFHFGKSGHFWLFDEINGLFKLSLDGEVSYHWPTAELDAQTEVSTITYRTGFLHEDMGGTVWLAMPFRKGLLTIKSNETKLTLPENLPQGEIYNGLWEDFEGNLIVGSFLSFGKFKRLFCVKKDGEVEDLQSLLNIEKTISQVFRPKNENLLWIGSFVGLFKVGLQNRPVSWLLAERQLEDNQWDDGISIRNITGDDQGNIFISRELSAWYQTNTALDSIRQIHLFDQEGQPIKLWCCSNLVWDPKGVVWGGSCTDNRDGLLHRYDVTTKTTRTFQVPGKTIRHMVWGADGQLLLATGAQNMECKLLFFDTEKENFSEYRNKDGSNPLAGKEPQFILQSQNAHIWIGTKIGLVQIDKNAGTSQCHLRTSSNLTNDDVLSIHEDEESMIWLGTRGGLNILNPETGEVEDYNTSHGLSNNVVAGILPDGEGGYWISTFHGLSHFSPETKLFSTFFKNKGLTFNEFNRLASYRDNEGKFYFGTINGINVFRNEDLKTAPFDQLSPQWTQISVFNGGQEHYVQQANFDNLEKIVLSHGDDLVKFEFSLPVFENPEGNRFAALLEGLDTTWQYLGNQPYFEVNNPPAGKYNLRVKAAPTNGHWGDNELNVRLEVSKPFYQTTWFQLGVPLAILMLSYFIARLYINRIKNKEEEQTRINKKFAELELQALQSQMNPHFVFNSLGAIQYFIQKNKPEAADAYLSKFAKLMRLFLESSKNKYISLSEEIKLLSLYIELEQMRFDDKFDAEIHVAEEIDTHSRELPSILIQPFVENAINHGLFNKRTKGCLKIDFQENLGGTLTCTIHDNGVGRKKAEALKKHSTRNYKSRGMQIVRERLQVLQEVDEMKINISIKDLNPGETEPGTRVVIELPDPDDA